jgi:sugar lactone lactonase YvrE
MKKNITYVLLLFIISQSSIAQHSLHRIWVTDSILPVPESVLYDEKDQILYTSLMDGSPAERDGKGSIGKLTPEGKIINLNWISGLNAPKGMARHKNILFVADLTEIVIIDLKQQKILKKITVDGSKILNDVTVDEKGVVYVSDPKVGKIFKLENDIPTTYLENLIKPNGLKFIDDYLYYLDNGSLYKMDNKKNKQTLAEGMDENTDGIEQVTKGKYIVSCWTGILYYVNENGSKETLSDTRKEEYYSADIGFDNKKMIVYVPSLFKKTITAYSLK